MYHALRELFGKPPTHNVAPAEKWVSIGGGLVLVGKGLKRPGPLGLLNLALGAAVIYRGVRGYCPAKQRLREMREQRLAPPSAPPAPRFK